MKNFHQSLICLDLRFVQTPDDAKILYNGATGFVPDEVTQNYIFELKISGAKSAYLTEIGDVMFIDWSNKKGKKNIHISHQMECDITNFIKSATPKTKGVGHGLVMIEPGRFTKESLSEFFINNCGVDNLSEKIFLMKSKGVSKVWVYMPSEEIIFFKLKSSNKIDISYFVERVNLVKMFGTKESDLNLKPTSKKKVLDLVEKVPQSGEVPKNQKPILEIDAILDKISKFGMDSLLKEELEFLKGIK